MKYYISDTNFGNENVLISENRPFASVEEMDQFMMDQWNNMVETDDDVYILGDFCCESQKSPTWYLQRLNGRKHLIVGKGDWVILKDEAAQKEFVSIDWRTSVPDAGYDHTVDLCYFPLTEWNGEYRGLHVYGYLNQDTILKSQDLWWWSATYYAGCMISGYTPMTIDKIIVNNLDFLEKTKQDYFNKEQECFKALYGTHKGPLRLKDSRWIMPITENGHESIQQCSVNHICSEYSQSKLIWHFYAQGERSYEHNFRDVIESAIYYADSFEIGEEDKEEYGVLFNMNYIWEKYLESLMNNENKKVISQKEEEILLKDQKARKIMKMDFYFEDKNLVLDAKYKNCWSEIMYNEIMQNNTKLWTEGRDDIFQILSYMYRMDCHQGGVVAPVPDKKEDDQNSKWNNLTLDKLKYKVFPTKEDTFYLMPLFIPKGEMSYSDFSETMQKYEGIFKDLLDKI